MPRRARTVSHALAVRHCHAISTAPAATAAAPTSSSGRGLSPITRASPIANSTDVLRSVSTKPEPPIASASIRIRNEPPHTSPITTSRGQRCRTSAPSASIAPRPAAPIRAMLIVADTASDSAKHADGFVPSPSAALYAR